MRTATKPPRTAYLLRIPHELKVAMEARAARNYRSLNEEIVQLCATAVRDEALPADAVAMRHLLEKAHHAAMTLIPTTAGGMK